MSKLIRDVYLNYLENNKREREEEEFIICYWLSLFRKKRYQLIYSNEIEPIRMWDHFIYSHKEEIERALIRSILIDEFNQNLQIFILYNRSISKHLHRPTTSCELLISNGFIIAMIEYSRCFHVFIFEYFFSMLINYSIELKKNSKHVERKWGTNRFDYLFESHLDISNQCMYTDNR